MELRPSSLPPRAGIERHRASALALAAPWVVALATACGSGSGGSSTPASEVGELATKPGGGKFFVDQHQSGESTRIHLVETTWGRLVDVHAIDERGEVVLEPEYRNVVINETVITNATTYVLERNPITGKTRLVIQRTADSPGFETLLRSASELLAPVRPLPPGISQALFSAVPRNACLVLRFDDVLADSPENEKLLANAIHVTAGYPPITPVTPRIVFSETHGAIVRGEFHATRVLIDMTVDEAEAQSHPLALPLNTLGLPPSQQGALEPNVVVELPYEVDAVAGQFHLLTSLGGAPLAADGNGPTRSTPVPSVVRAMRSGNFADANNGFLLDIQQPTVTGAWPMIVLDAVTPPGGDEGFDYLVDMRFETPCGTRPNEGDILSTSAGFLRVVGAAAPPNGEGVVEDVPVRVVSERPSPPTAILGSGSFRLPYAPDVKVPDACWVDLVPRPAGYPFDPISPDTQFTVRFSEPMDPASFEPADSFQLVRGSLSTEPSPLTLVVGGLAESAELNEFTFQPLLPLAHQGEGAPFHLRLQSKRATFGRGLTDLSGNKLAFDIPLILFEVDKESPQYANGGITQRFDSIDELPRFERADVRGNVFVDPNRGILRPRIVAHNTWTIDQFNPVPSIMIAFPPGIQTPLSPLGSKLQAVWRYADAGWAIRDEFKYDLDVVGLHWSPATTSVVGDYYPEFEIRLSHSAYLPDETRNSFGGAKYPASGLGNGGRRYEDNILNDPASPQKIVHARELGYRISPIDMTVSESGTRLLPWPMNRSGGPRTSFTWRDTNALSKAGPDGVGVPMSVEVDPPLNLEEKKGDFARQGRVPTVGLPLLMEFRCYPTALGIGLNPLAIFLAINTSAQPNFRAFSTGGLDTQRMLVTKNPDFEIFPTGGFNPTSNPPGRPTRFQADNSLYLGAIDTVVRVSRGHSAWFDTGFLSPSFSKAIVKPEPSTQPGGTSVVVDYRGADDFDTVPPLGWGNARTTDPYGDPNNGTVSFHDGVATWSESPTALDGARYVQMRYSFVNNVDSGVYAELSSVAFAFSQ